jgi:tol-pal system protein YbgF
MSHRAFLLATFMAAAAITGASAQTPPGVDRRFERLEQSVRALQTAVQQAQATGQPVVVRPEGPDPVATALQERVNDLEQTLQRLNGQAENLAFEIDQAKRASASAETDRQRALQAQNERLARIEAQLAALALPPEGVEPLAQGPNDALRSPDAGVPPPPPPPPPANATEAFARARALFTANDHAAAATAFEDFVARYPSNARAPEAYYWLGETYFVRRGYQTATAAYANALKSRPNTAWAPSAMARLAQSLANSNQIAQACAALADFDKTYAARATAAAKANAQTARTRAKCS